MNALEKMYNMAPEERRELGQKGRQHVLDNYSFKLYGERWDNLFENLKENYGSWDTRKNYRNWHLKEVK